nr:GNAT family N-acetyltransferase [Bacteriovorax sp. HI3]
MSFVIRPATYEDITLVIENDKRHMKEPGFNGSLSHPFLPDHEFDWDKRKEERLLAWTKPVTEEGWSRSFILVQDDLVLGHVHLKNLFHATLHRAQLGMGLEMAARGQGHGKKLLEMAIAWAREQESLSWIDLSYFAHNIPAKKLYTSCGFKELFVYEDRLRVGHHVIDDVVMTLKLK